jgi:transposase
VAAPAVKLRWSDEAKGRMVAQTQAQGVAVNKMARRHGLTASHLSSWRRLARRGKLVVPEVAGAEVAAPVASPIAVAAAAKTASIDLITRPVTLRRDATSPSVRIAELAMALRAGS